MFDAAAAIPAEETRSPRGGGEGWGKSAAAAPGEAAVAVATPVAAACTPMPPPSPPPPAEEEEDGRRKLPPLSAEAEGDDDPFVGSGENAAEPVGEAPPATEEAARRAASAACFLRLNSSSCFEYGAGLLLKREEGSRRGERGGRGREENQMHLLRFKKKNGINQAATFPSFASLRERASRSLSPPR